MFDDLIGAQLDYFTHNGFAVKMPDGSKRHFRFTREGDEYGTESTIETRLFFDDENNVENPVITKVEYKAGGYGSASDLFDEDGNATDEEICDELKITFFGLYRPIAEIEATSVATAYYGSCVCVTCIETGEEEVLASTQ